MYRPKSHIEIGKNRIPVYGICVVSGYALGAILFLSLVRSIGLSMIKGGLAVLIAIVSSWFLGLLAKRLSGRENFVFLHFALTIILSSALALFLMNEPVLPYLDMLAPGILLGLAVGRLGCLHAGCCHGCKAQSKDLGNLLLFKPNTYRHNHFTVTYPKPHTHANIPLFPIQAIESLGALLLLTLLVWVEIPLGQSLAWSALGYGFLRFILEIFRGDTGRPYLFGLSEAQWTLGGMNILVFFLIENELIWTLAFGLFVIVAIGWLIWVNSPLGAIYRWFHPVHVEELRQKASRDFMLQLVGGNPSVDWRSSEGASVQVWKADSGEWNCEVIGPKDSKKELAKNRNIHIQASQIKTSHV